MGSTTWRTRFCLEKETGPTEKVYVPYFCIAMFCPAIRLDKKNCWICIFLLKNWLCRIFWHWGISTLKSCNFEEFLDFEERLWRILPIFFVPQTSLRISANLLFLKICSSKLLFLRFAVCQSCCSSKSVPQCLFLKVSVPQRGNCHDRGKSSRGNRSRSSPRKDWKRGRAPLPRAEASPHTPTHRWNSGRQKRHQNIAFPPIFALEGFIQTFCEIRVKL